MNIRKIKKIEKDGTIKEITVDWDKLPCAKCDRRYHFCCPKPDCWNKKHNTVFIKKEKNEYEMSGM